jgi:excisionase family DNA binding protein
MLHTRAQELTSRVTEEWKMNDLLTVAETAQALNLKVSTVRAWLARRKLPRVNCGRAVRIPANAVTDFIERNTIPAREPRQ